MPARLDTWKEIAAYLKKGTRTVQRWEREENLPVHRLQHEAQGSVYAFPPELDAWWAGRDEAQERKRSERVTLTVTPFSDLSPEKDQAYFCEGIAEEILTALHRLRGLKVMPRSGVAGTTLEGSVRKSGARLRISVRLIDTTSGEQKWAETFDGDLQDVFAVQEKIARRVASTLEVHLSPHESEALSRSATSDVEALDLYLRGRRYYYGYGPQDMEFAIQLFSAAVARDSSYARAYAGLADCWSYLYLYSTRDDTLKEQATWAARKAAELEPGSAQAHASLALALSLTGATEDAEAEFDRAIELDPDLFEAHYFYARHAFAQGDLPKALALYEEAMRVRPDDYQAPLLAAQSYETTGNPDTAREARRRGITLAERHLQLNPDDVRARYMAANGMVALGDLERGRQWAETALTLRPNDPMVLYNVGCIYAMAGALPQALDVLERAVDQGLTQKGWFAHDTNLDSLRQEPRFRAILQRLGGEE